METGLAICYRKCRICAMRSIFFLLAGSVLFISGCVDRPERSPSAYGTILEALPVLKEAEAPFPFPIGEDGNDHQNCEFDEMDFM